MQKRRIKGDMVLLQCAGKCANGQVCSCQPRYGFRSRMARPECWAKHNYNPAGANSSCPATGIKYLPKTGTGPSPPGTTTSVGTSPTSAPRVPFSGRGTLLVTSGGKQNGCIISGGTWYTTGTCATFTATTIGSQNLLFI